MQNIAIDWAYGLWPLLVGAGIAIVFRNLLTKPKDVLLIVLVVYGLQGVCRLPYDIANLLVRSHIWLDQGEILPFGPSIGNAMAFLLSLVLCARIARWAGGKSNGV